MFYPRTYTHFLLVLFSHSPFSFFVFLFYLFFIGWFQGINVVAHDASAIEESNALALAIVPSGSGIVFLNFPLQCFPSHATQVIFYCLLHLS